MQRANENSWGQSCSSADIFQTRWLCTCHMKPESCAATYEIRVFPWDGQQTITGHILLRCQDINCPNRVKGMLWNCGYWPSLAPRQAWQVYSCMQLCLITAAKVALKKNHQNLLHHFPACAGRSRWPSHSTSFPRLSLRWERLMSICLSAAPKINIHQTLFTWASMPTCFSWHYF